MNALNTSALISWLGYFVNNIAEAWFDDLTLPLMDNAHRFTQILSEPQKFAITFASAPWLAEASCALVFLAAFIFFQWHSSEKQLTENSSTTNQHIDIADGLRGLAILLVMLFHFWEISWWPVSIPFTSGKINLEFIEVSGKLGVELFFFLSAFCLTYPHAKSMFENSTLPSLAHYTYRRAIKILPSYWLAMLLLLLFLPTMFPTSVDRGFWTDVFMHLTFIHNLFEDTHFSINGVFWTLGVEIQFYILFPILAWIFRRKPWLTFFVLCITSVAYRYWTRTLPDFLHWNSQLPGFLDLFAAGMLSAYLLVLLRQRVVTKIKIAMTAVSALAFVILLLLFENLYEIRYEPDGVTFWQSYHRLYLALVFILLLVASSYSYLFWRKIVTNRVLTFLSLISYNLYLWHQVVGRVIRDRGWWTANTAVPTDDPQWRWTMFFISIAVSIVVASVITYLIERPLLKYGVRDSLVRIKNIVLRLQSSANNRDR